jgi:hypothetical protein
VVLKSLNLDTEEGVRPARAWILELSSAGPRENNGPNAPLRNFVAQARPATEVSDWPTS